VTGIALRALRLQDLGPRVRVRFSRHPEQGYPGLSPVEATTGPLELVAMVDTGSSLTVLQPGSFQRLGIVPSEETWIGSPAAQRQPHPSYVGTLTLAGTTGEVSMVARAVEIPGLGHVDALLGRDVLTRGRFLYDGREGACAMVLGGTEIPMMDPLEDRTEPGRGGG